MTAQTLEPDVEIVTDDDPGPGTMVAVHIMEPSGLGHHATVSLPPDADEEQVAVAIIAAARGAASSRGLITSLELGRRIHD